MCVIIVVHDDKHRPNDAMVEACWDSNDKGGGVAWIAPSEQSGKPVAKWHKGIDTWKHMAEYAKELPVPYVLHFRIPSVGPATRMLTHPFPIDEDGSNALEGESENGVLFHNGTWSKWREALYQFTLSNRIKFPGGVWSDTRAMAFLTAHLGPQWPALLDEKVCILLPENSEGEPDVILHGSWSFENEMAFSNMYWKNRQVWQRFEKQERRSLPSDICVKYITGRVCNCDKCCQERAGGNREDSGSTSGTEKRPPYGPQGSLRANGHPVTCECMLCAAADLVSRQTGASESASVDPTSTGRDSIPAQSNPIPTYLEIKSAYEKASKKQIKRLRHKASSPKGRASMSVLESRLLMFANAMDRRKENERKNREAALKAISDGETQTLH